MNKPLRWLALSAGLTTVLVGGLTYYANQPNILSRWVKFYPDGHIVRGVTIEPPDGPEYEGAPDDEDGVAIGREFIGGKFIACSIKYSKGLKSLSISTQRLNIDSYDYTALVDNIDRTDPYKDIRQGIQISESSLTWDTTTKIHLENLEERKHLSYDSEKKRLMISIVHNQKPFSGDFIDKGDNDQDLLSTYKDGKVIRTVTGEFEELLELRQREATTIDYTAKAKQQIEQWRATLLQELNLSHLKSTSCEVVDAPITDSRQPGQHNN